MKARSLDKLKSDVRTALQKQFGYDEMNLVPWIAELFYEYVIAEMNENEYFQIPYTATESEVTFVGREDWIKVQSQRIWVEAKSREFAAKFDLSAPCRSKAIKVIDSGSRRIGAYATVWGELDCENDRMTPAAIEPYIGKAAPMMFWLHGLDKEFGSSPVGAWDTDSFKLDELGLFVEGHVGNDHWGDLAWQRINSAKSFGLSVGSLWYLVKKSVLEDGSKEITDWPLVDISLMEGGRQCVPSAQQKLNSDLQLAYEFKAKQLGIVIKQPTGDGGLKNKGVTNMEPNEPTTVDISTMVAQAVDSALKAKEAAEKAEVERQATITAKAQELAAAEVTKRQAEWEAQKAALEDQLKTAKKTRQPAAPPVGNGDGEGSQPNFIKVYSPYDRLDTMDLCTRYELMKSYGKQPSVKFWRALAERAVKMARDEDTIYIKNGREVKVPAVDFDALIPRNLDLNEVDGDLVGAKAGRSGIDTASDSVTPTGLKQFLELAIKSNELIYSTQSSYGDEWVPTLMNAQLWRTIRLNAAVLGLLNQFDMPSQPYDYPTESTDPTFYLVGETTNEAQLILTGGPFTDSKVGTSKVTFSAGKLGGISYWSEEMEEDAIIATEPQIRDQYGMKMAHVIDEVLISGDESTGSSNISYDGASIAAASHFLVLDGLRHQPLVTTTSDARDAGALTIDDFGITQSLMGTAGKFGVNPNDLAFIMDPAVWHKTKLLSEVLTVDKFGPAATIRTGQLGSLFGTPLIVSEDYALTSSTGVISSTGGNNTLGSFMCVNLRGVMVGWRRRPRIRVVGLPGAEARYIVASARLDIGFKEAGMVGLSYNVTV